MRRIGNPWWAYAALLAASSAAASDVELYQTVDRPEVGTEDTFRLTVVTVNAPADAKLRLPDLSQFEVLSNTPMSQTSIQVTNSGTEMQRIRKQVLVLRPRRSGTFTIGPATLTVNGETQTTNTIEVVVRASPRVPDPGAGSRTQRDPFRDFFSGRFRNFPGFPDDPFGPIPDVDVPASESDLFIRTYVDKRSAYIGEQITFSVYVFSRVEISSVDTVVLPRLEGFWSEDLESPTQLSGEQRLLNGVPYRAYLLKRKALFPNHAGKVDIDPVKADITTGYLFAGHRVHRVGNRVTVDVKPLPKGAPPGFASAHVGQWELTREVAASAVKLGEPLTVRVILSGRGNLKNQTPPRLEVPPSFRLYDPTTSDEVKARGGQFAGRRAQEYLVMPSQTGSFTLPEASFAYFDPEKERYEVTRAPALTIQVDPAAGGVASAAGLSGGALPGDPQAAKNVLTADGLRPLRHEMHLGDGTKPVWARGWFVPAVLSPLGLWAALGAFGLARARLGREDVQTTRRRKTRAARRRLEMAEKLRETGSVADFYAEVDKAIIHLLEAKFGEPVGGLTRDALDAHLRAHGVSDEARRRVLSVLETCELGRFAPASSLDIDRDARARAMEAAAAAMEALDAR
jgi:hypothetical protein